MDTATVLCIVGLLLRITVAAPAYSWDESDPSIASVVVKEGESAEIYCMLKESNVAYFWLKGGSLENSTVVGSFISGITINDPDDPFTVTENGTLIIKKVSRNDEGNYICRVSSEEISCHGDVFVFVQAVLQDFHLTIEYCEPENSCVISTESTKPTSLTCKATNASPSMKLKWFNGSREIKDNIEGNSLTKGTSKEISSTIKDVYKAPSTLTCQAVDFKTSNDDGMFAHVQFHTPASSTDISPGWMVTAILFIVGFVMLLLFVIFITAWLKVRNGKDVETQNSPERVGLLKSNNERLEADLKTKNDEITKLNANLKTKDEEIKKQSEDITKLNTELIETKADKRVDESNVTSKDKDLLKLEKSLETVKGELLKKTEEHQTQKDSDTESLNKKDLEIQKLQSKLEHVEEQLTKIQNREQEISSKEGILSEREIKIKGREFEMNSIESKLRDRETNVKRREDDMKSKEQTLTERETEVKRREDEMVLTESEYRGWGNICKTREESLKLKESSLWEQAKNIKKREDKVTSKEIRLTDREAETKEQLLDLERRTRKFRSDQMDLKDPVQVNCRIIASMTVDDAHVATVEKGGQSKVKAGKKWIFLNKDATFHTVYPANTKPIDLCESIADIIENAIDGRNSCLIAHDVSGREHRTTMFGPDEGAIDAIVPYAIATIFRRTKELTALDYKVDVKARFMDNTTDTPTNISQKKVEIANENTANELLKHGLGKIVQKDGNMDHFVQFYIETKTDKGTSTGVLVLGTFRSIQMIKECFRSVEPTTQLTRNISEIISDGRCRSVLITHIHEDKLDESRDCLAMVEKISKKNKK